MPSQNAALPTSRHVPPLLLVSAAALLILTIAGPFGTQRALSTPSRALFWCAILGLNALKWTLWRRLVVEGMGTAARRWLGFAAGAALLNALLPLEIFWALQGVGKAARIDYFGTWLGAVGITIAIGLLREFALPERSSTQIADDAQPGPAETLPPVVAEAPQRPRPLFERGGVHRPSDLLAVRAEDHYLRLHLSGGRQPLILYRFSDAMADLAGVDGEQVHRGAWVAPHAVKGAEREGRRWRLRLSDGSVIPVSESYVGAARRRGWLRPAMSD